MSDGEEDVHRREGRDHPFAGQRHTAAALPNRLQSVKSSYDAVAAEYAERISGELEGKPFDRALLDEIAAGATGLICDLGCGPGMWRTTCISVGLLSWESISRPR